MQTVAKKQQSDLARSPSEPIDPRRLTPEQQDELARRLIQKWERAIRERGRSQRIIKGVRE